MQEREPRLVRQVEVQGVEEDALHAEEVVRGEAVGGDRGELLHAGVGHL